MNGWSLSGSMKANHHWQSGTGGEKFPAEFNPFSTYRKNVGFQSTSFTLNQTGTTLAFTNGNRTSAGSEGLFGNIAGLYRGTVYQQSLYGVKFTEVEQCGVITIKSRIPKDLKDVIFYLDKSEAVGALYNTLFHSTGYMHTAYYYPATPAEGSNSYMQYKIRGTMLRDGVYSLNDGINIYINFTDSPTTSSYWGESVYAMFAGGVTYNYFVMNLETSRELTTDEITVLSSDNYNKFVIGGKSRAITLEEYNAA